MEKKQCPFCNSELTQKDGRQNNMQRYRCIKCKKRFLSGKYEGDFSYITHFNTKIKKTNRNILTRENYCTPSCDVDYNTKKELSYVRHFFEYTGRYPSLAPSYYRSIPNDIFSDYEHFTEEYVNKHYQECMQNFDLNMTYFESLEFAQFDHHLSAFVKKNRFIEITDLKDVVNSFGIYILVLDKYKQVYIGKSKTIKARILSHWNGKKEFSRLIFGDVDSSILSIDAFGALDTTRIFVREYKCSHDLDTTEQKLIEKFDAKYCLNRVAGGLNSKQNHIIRNQELQNTKKVRNFSNESDK